MNEPILTITFPEGISIKSHLQETALIREIHHWKVYDKIIPLKEGDIVVDAGAYNGVFSLRAAAQGASQVIAVEPIPHNFKLLVENISKNQHLFNIKFHLQETALAEYEGIARLYVGGGPGGYSLVAMMPGKESNFIETRMTTLDKMMEKLELNRVDFLKIDIEGAAGYLLDGARSFLEQDKAKLGVAIYHHESEAAAVQKLLDEYDFEYKVFNIFGQLWMEDDEFDQALGKGFFQAWKN